MVVDLDIRARLSDYCTVNKLTQEKAANLALRHLLQHADEDAVLKAKMDRVRVIKEELAAI